MRQLVIILIALLGILAPQTGVSHALDPGYLELVSVDESRWRVTWRVPDVNGRPMPIEALLPETCTHEPPPFTFDGRAWTARWIAVCPDGLAGGDIVIGGLETTRTDTLVRYELTPGKVQVERLTAATTGFTIPPEAGPLDILQSYVGLGITHILEGIDHLIFVFALVLLVRGRARLLWAITAFTLAHSITLAAAALGTLNLPPPPVEAVIALSIVFLAYELALPPERRDPFAERFPWVVSFSFGLIHGLGFAGALREIGLPQDDIPLALFAFNAGVEIGQILFIAVVWAVGAALYRLYPMLTQHGRALTRGAGYAIGSLAAFWVIDRVLVF